MTDKIKCFFVEPTGDFTKWRKINHGRARSPILRRVDTGELIEGYDKVPVGGMWYAPWLDEMFDHQLDHVLIVRTPGGDWMPDSEAANCTAPADKHPKQQDHHCWVIHGEAPNLTVDKKGVTCKAGAGSIGQKNWHGFLKGGYLVQ